MGRILVLHPSRSGNPAKMVERVADGAGQPDEPGAAVLAE